MGTSSGPVGRLGWYARRLRMMSPHEVAWRGASLVAQRVPRRNLDSSSERVLRPGLGWDAAMERFRAADGRPLLLDRARGRLIAVDHPELVSRLVAAADQLRAGRVRYFGYPEVQLASPVDWNHDLVRNLRWPDREADRIDHRTAAGDPKWIWELNRLQHLPVLAEAWLFTGDDGYAEHALDHLDSWLDQNPPGRGIAWRGAFEAGIRAISVALALQGLRDSPALTPARFRRTTAMLAASADLCWRQRSRFSSANNHLVGELAGLATVAMLMPELDDAARWKNRAWKALAVEASRQILPDGAGAEQAVGYQVFTAELLLLAAALLRSHGGAPPPEVSAAVGRSATYLAALVGEEDPEPRYGDDDEGFALRLGPEAQPTVRAHLGVAAAWTGDESVRRAGRPTLSAVWVAAMGKPATVPELDPAPAAQRSFLAADGGLAVLRAGRRRVTMDVGPLGYLSIAAHGHADALAITLSVAGREIVGDPGAASYYGHPEWRAVHRGTRAHATVTVDGADQSVSGGPFLWTEHARVGLRTVDLERGVVDAEHDGYRRLTSPAHHRRWLLAPPEEDAAILILDEMSGSGEHEVRVSWPVHPDLDVEVLDSGFLLTGPGGPAASLAIAATQPLALDRVRGDASGQLGWWSHRLEARVPAWLLSGVARGPMPLLVATVIDPSGGGRHPTDLSVVQDGEDVSVSWCSAHTQHTVVVDRTRPGALDLHSVPGRESEHPPEGDVDSGPAPHEDTGDPR